MIQKIIHFLARQRTRKAAMDAFISEYEDFKKLAKDDRFTINKEDLYPCLFDNTATTAFDAHYVYHPAWASRVIKEINPAKHIDISSTLYFCTSISAFYPTEFYDYRPAPLTLSGLVSGSADLNNLFFESDSVECISCMHTIEHIGLGRYGDIPDPDADLRAISELQRVTKPGGHLLLVTPVGRPRIQFNAHRIYSFDMINNLFNDFELLDFSLVKDNGTFMQNTDPALVQEQAYGCGCFWYRKKI